MSTLYFDLETQKSADDVGGWRNTRLMRMSVGVIYEEESGEYAVFQEQDAAGLIEALRQADLVVGFNLLRFDYTVLSYYTEQNFSSIRTVDMLHYIKTRYDFFISLEKIAQATLGSGKSGNGLEALEWFKRGEMDKIIEYCKQDVKVTRDVYCYGKENSHIFVPGFVGGKRKLEVKW